MLGLPSLKSIVPRNSDGTLFLGYKVPATYLSSYMPNDEDAYLEKITGKSGNELRELLQSPIGAQLIAQSQSGQLNRNVTYMSSPGFGVGACSSDGDCATNQLCYLSGGKSRATTISPKMCRDVVYPEMTLGNAYNNGTPLRQYSNVCQTDKDCQGIDAYTKKPKKGMACNHFYRGPIAEQYGLCQVTYNGRDGKRFFLPTPDGLDKPLYSPLLECKTNTDCGPSGINGFTRCVSGAADGKNYCLYPGQTGLLPPKNLQDFIPRGITEEHLKVKAKPQ